MAQSIVNAKLMADVALEFNIGADLLSKANRSIDKYLGAEKKSIETKFRLRFVLLIRLQRFLRKRLRCLSIIPKS